MPGNPQYWPTVQPITTADGKITRAWLAALTQLGQQTQTAGNVTTAATLTAGQLIVGAGGSAITVGNLTGDVTTSGSTATTLSSTGVTPGTYGDATNVGQFTVDAKGRISFAANVPIAGGGGGTAGDIDDAFFLGGL